MSSPLTSMLQLPSRDEFLLYTHIPIHLVLIRIFKKSKHGFYKELSDFKAVIYKKTAISGFKSETNQPTDLISSFIHLYGKYLTASRAMEQPVRCWPQGCLAKISPELRQSRWIHGLYSDTLPVVFLLERAWFKRRRQ